GRRGPGRHLSRDRHALGLTPDAAGAAKPSSTGSVGRPSVHGRTTRQPQGRTKEETDMTGWKPSRPIGRRTVLKGASAAAIAAGVGALPFKGARADMAAAEKWVTQEFQPSTLTKDQQMAEMKFFIDAAQPFKGMDISVVSETIDTHVYETKTLAKAF